jgi:hypothetical protein
MEREKGEWREGEREREREEGEREREGELGDSGEEDERGLRKEMRWRRGPKEGIAS